MTDREAVEATIKEWRCGAPGGVIVPSILEMLQKLVRVHSDNTTVEGACGALETMSRDALSIRDTLKKMKAG